MKLFDSVGFKIIAFLVFGAGSAWRFSEYFGDERHGMKLLGGAVFGILSVYYLVEVIRFFRRERLEDKSKSA